MGVRRYKLSVLWGVDRGMYIIWKRLKYGIMEVTHIFCGRGVRCDPDGGAYWKCFFFF